MNNALIVRNVSKTFDKFKLDNISFEVPGGSIVGVIRLWQVNTSFCSYGDERV